MDNKDASINYSGYILVPDPDFEEELDDFDEELLGPIPADVLAINQQEEAIKAELALHRKHLDELAALHQKHRDELVALHQKQQKQWKMDALWAEEDWSDKKCSDTMFRIATLEFHNDYKDILDELKRDLSVYVNVSEIIFSGGDPDDDDGIYDAMVSDDDYDEKLDDDYHDDVMDDNDNDDDWLDDDDVIDDDEVAYNDEVVKKHDDEVAKKDEVEEEENKYDWAVRQFKESGVMYQYMKTFAKIHKNHIEYNRCIKLKLFLLKPLVEPQTYCEWYDCFDEIVCIIQRSTTRLHEAKNTRDMILYRRPAHLPARRIDYRGVVKKYKEKFQQEHLEALNRRKLSQAQQQQQQQENY